MLERHLERIILAHEPPFELGAVRFHPSHRLVGNGEQSFVVQPRVMQVLVALARSDGAILSRDDIMEQCWNGRIVGDNALHRAVGHARKVLDRLGEDTLQIETVKGVGYRLRSAGFPTDLLDPPRSHSAKSGPILSRRLALGAIGAASLVAVGGSLLFRDRENFPSKFAADLFAQAEAARRAEYMGSNEQAVSLYREAIRDSPSFAAAWGGLSLTYCQMMNGALDAELSSLAGLARSAADRCLQLDPESLEGRLAQAVVPSHFRRWDERKKQLAGLLDDGREDWTLNAYLGRVAADIGDDVSAVNYFSRAHDAQPAAAGVAGQLAYAQWSSGMLHELEQLLDVSSKRWQRSWYLWNVRFNYLAYSGRYEAAAEQVQSEGTLPFSLHPNAVGKRLRLVRALRLGQTGDIQASKETYLAEAVERPSHVRNGALALAALGARNELLEVLRGYLLGQGAYPTEINTYSRRPTFFLFLPPFDRFWSDSAFVELMNEVGLQRS